MEKKFSRRGAETQSLFWSACGTRRRTCGAMAWQERYSARRRFCAGTRKRCRPLVVTALQKMARRQARGPILILSVGEIKIMSKITLFAPNISPAAFSRGSRWACVSDWQITCPSVRIIIRTPAPPPRVSAAGRRGDWRRRTSRRTCSRRRRRSCPSRRLRERARPLGRRPDRSC